MYCMYILTDVFSIHLTSLETELPRLQAGVQTTFTMGLEVTCMLDTCPGSATHPVLAAPTHYSILLKVLLICL